MNEFYILLPENKLPSVAEWQQRLMELEPGFTLDTKFNPLEGGVWECSYSDDDVTEKYCCDFSMEDTKELFKEAPELVEYTNGCKSMAIFFTEENDINLAASYALAEALLSLVPGSFLFDPFEGQLMHAEDGVAFFNEELTIEEFGDDE